MINRLKSLLEAEDYTCVLYGRDEVISSRERGIKPLIGFIDSGNDFNGFSAADKIVGKAAALLYAYMGVKELYAEVIGRQALEVCEKYGIAVTYGIVTPKIINRKGDGVCPMEEAVEGINDPASAVTAVKEKLKRL